MFTQQQKEAAFKALERQKTQKKQQYISYLAGIMAREKIGETMLPYRVLYDLEVLQFKNELKEIPPNRYYPADGMPPDVEHLAISLMPGNEEQSSQRRNDPNYQKKRAEFVDLEKAARTPSDRWKFYYAHFLKDYDFVSFKPFDFTGKANTTEEEVRNIREFLIRLQCAYLANPERYFSGASY